MLIPSLLFFIFKLPTNLKESYFILNPSNVSFFTLFLSNYVHSSSQHFAGNFLSYFIVCFLIFNFETKKRDFYAYSIFMFLILPWLISIISLNTIVLQTTYQGFSGIVSSMFGYLAYSLYKFLKKYCCGTIKITSLYLLVILNLYMILGNIPSEMFHSILILTIAVFLIFLQKETFKEIVQNRFKIKNWLRKLSMFQQLYLTLVLPFTIVSIFVLPILVPQNILQNGVIINSLAHYIGYFFGVFVPLVFCAITRILSLRKNSSIGTSK